MLLTGEDSKDLAEESENGWLTECEKEPGFGPNVVEKISSSAERARVVKTDVKA
jgi:hypothetical protein